MEQTQTQTGSNRSRDGPIIETQIGKSKDGKWIIHKTIITDIKPVTYFKKVIENDRQ